MTHVLIVQGHPDPAGGHLCHALAQAYAEGAAAAGHAVETVTPALLEFPLLRSAAEWEHGTLPPALADAQAALGRADHVLLVFPLWLGDMPALLKGFLEQVARPGFALARDADNSRNPLKAGLLKGKSARVVATMGMPAAIYRWVYRAHSVKSLERNILGFVGFAPVRHTLVGTAGNLDEAAVRRWCGRMRRLGAHGQ
ncbi:putative NADPH-quinone reductase [Pseudoduganella flava]|uniref:Flavodoxin family protein n=1 Tax=Pseudoduganella flava TaxID=871742 RepID=A0A562PRH8_9BURK|nr:NAD(P)H-dependent oxidoreductase [Pseudoduganella flava]QGZ37932.1 flavodoxin family protein [Pseudoduganella flava]TWI46770.1 putative NADPH-quinone reductase [Pseudoduganella flava]